MLKIVRSSEPLIVETLNVCLYGPPGIGKTSLGFTAQNPLLLDFDLGAYRAANRGDVVKPASWEDVVNITPKDLSDYQTVVIDTAGRALDALSAEIGKNPKLRRGEGLTLQGFGELKGRFLAWMKLLRSLKKDVVMLAHMEEVKSGDDLVERLDVVGGSKAEIYKTSDAMGRITFDAKGQRVIDFSPRPNAFGKNPCSLDLVPFPNPATALDTLGKLITQIKQSLNELTKEQKQTQDLILEWKSWLETVTTTSDLNSEIGRFQQQPKFVQQMVHNKARSLGFKWNPKDKQYEETKQDVGPTLVTT